MKKLIVIFAMLFSTASYTLDVEQSPNIEKYINQMVTEHGFDKQKLTQEFISISFNPEVINKVIKMDERKIWYDYPKTVLTKERIDAGIKFWQQYQTELSNAEKKYGVPPEIIVAIIGIASDYGKRLQNYPIFQSLATLAFDKSELPAHIIYYFKRELTVFLLRTKKQGIDPLTLKGTYAGAYGLANFMPNSLHKFSIDFNKDGNKELMQPADAIGSIAYYLAWRGWQKNGPIIIPATVTGSAYKELPVNQFKFDLRAGNLKKYGISTEQPLPNYIKISLIKIDLDNKILYWIAFHNFLALYQYNPHIHYAMAVFQLAQALKKGGSTVTPVAP